MAFSGETGREVELSRLHQDPRLCQTRQFLFRV